jgi:hypothetical protein
MDIRIGDRLYKHDAQSDHSVVSVTPVHDYCSGDLFWKNNDLICKKQLPDMIDLHCFVISLLLMLLYGT